MPGIKGPYTDAYSCYSSVHYRPSKNS